MSRPYEFRVWDNELECYNSTILTWVNNNPRFDIEQYIELKDKNGKKIFEGDIVQTNELDWIGKVVYNYDGFMLVAVDSNRGGFSSPSWGECTVLGNVHENKDLLKN